MAEKKTSASDLLSRIGASVEAPSPIILELDVEEAAAIASPAPIEAPVAAPEPAAAPVALPPQPKRTAVGGSRRKGASVGKTDANVPRETTRFSLDLDRAKHKEFKRFAIDAETDASVVGRILVDLLLEDESLQESVTARLAAMKSEG